VETYDPAVEEGLRPGSLEARASLALKVLAGINVFGIVLATIPGAVSTSTLQVFALHLTSAALAVVYVLVARGLDRRRPWAVSAIRPLLIVLVVWGVYDTITGLGAGAVRIPFATLGAGWALLGSADRRPLPRLNARGGAILVAAVLVIGIAAARNPLFGWGGYFDVHPQDLSASLNVDCGTSAGELPDHITVTYEWSWQNTTVLPNDQDVVVIGWNGDDAQRHPLYVFDAAPDPGDDVHLGSANRVSESLADVAAAPWEGSVRWGIELSTRGIKPGRVELVLRRAAAQPPDPQPLTIGASYVHVGVWRSETPTMTCSW
jgi:hypothetical protein